MKSIVYKDCKKCEQKRIPHKRMENRKDCDLICEGCGNIVKRGTSA